MSNTEYFNSANNAQWKEQKSARKGVKGSEKTTTISGKRVQ